MKPPRSHLALAILAAASLYFVLDLSQSGRGPVDWIVIGLVVLAILWNLFRLGQHLHHHGGGRALWHLQRTLLFWILGLLNTLPELREASTTWRLPVGLLFLLLALGDTILLAQKERKATQAIQGSD